ncbi:MAG: membrane protein DedA with SNARE-associated domain, partial [Myxococcota bacterium]
MDTLLRYGIVAVFVALMLTPLGLPVPEEVSLLVAGVLAANDHVTVPVALLVSYIGVTLGDVVGWTMGRRAGLHPTGFISRLVGPEQIVQIEEFYDRWGGWAIVIARQLPGMRLPAFFFAGASGIPLTRFLLIDGTAAIFTTSVFFSLGYIFADDIDAVLLWVDRFRSGSSTFALVGIVVFAIWIWRRRRKK